MKISKARLQQIIKEEVEAHLKQESTLLEVDEADMAGLAEESEVEEGLEGVISLIKDRGAEAAVKALKDKKEIDNPWALVNAALTKMGRPGLSRSDENVEPSEDQIFTTKRDPDSGERTKIPPKKNGIRVEIKSC